jgi:hypothetical protein
MADVTGTPRKVTLDGITFDVFADTNIKEVGSKWENAAVPTSGRNMHKMTKRVESREGITLATNGAERDILKELSERNTDFPMSYELASGDVYRATGWIEFESRETEENRSTVMLHPRTDWSAFLA